MFREHKTTHRAKSARASAIRNPQSGYRSLPIADCRFRWIGRTNNAVIFRGMVEANHLDGGERTGHPRSDKARISNDDGKAPGFSCS
jgi:hypothetical protein